MAQIIEPVDPEHVDFKYGVLSFYVRGKKYKNSSVSFWSSLICEARCRFPSAKKIIIESAPAVLLDVSMLFPGKLDLTSLDLSAHADLLKQYCSILNEMEIYGEPSSIRLKILDSADELIKYTYISPSVADAELFPFFLVWLLYWAKISPLKWNNDFLSGNFDAYLGAVQEGMRFMQIFFELQKINIHEELTGWLINVEFGMDAI